MKISTQIVALCLILGITGCTHVQTTTAEVSQEPRLALLAESELNDHQYRLLQPFIRDGRVDNIFKLLVKTPQLFAAWNDLGFYILRGSSLPARDRELLILRTAALTNSEYEFSQHAVIAQSVGISELEIEQIKDVSTLKGWTQKEAAILQGVGELVKQQELSDATWNSLSGYYNERQLIELIVSVGQYNMLAMLLNSARVPLDEHLPKVQFD